MGGLVDQHGTVAIEQSQQRDAGAAEQRLAAPVRRNVDHGWLLRGGRCCRAGSSHPTRSTAPGRGDLPSQAAGYRTGKDLAPLSTSSARVSNWRRVGCSGVTDERWLQALRQLGWAPLHHEAFATCDAEAVWPGRVSRIDRGGWLTVETAQGSRRARQHARFRRVVDALAAPTVGDWVVLRHDPGGGPPVAETILPRRSVFVRNAGDDDRAQPQPLAANIDSVLVVVALTSQYHTRAVDRFLALAWASGAEPVIVLTKADLVDEVEQVRAIARAQAGEIDVVALSGRTGAGLEELGRHLQPGRTVVLVGQSGAGKSTLANRLAGENILAAAEVRKDGRGRHTTTHRQLLRLPSGALLIDTPGLRSVGMWEAAGSLDEGAFTDVDQLAARCRFSDCAHEHEPGCAVQDALASGALTRARWESYRTLRAEADQVARARSQTERARRSGRRRS
ncbi:MAG: ribosome small subunit-dependent GTPase A [Nitriliruptorales bacterium]|nr:ribosome small subunit-dependent GTPase A [Nitriliruptorales bacterium]